MIHILNLIILNSLFDIRLFSLDFELDALKIKPVK